MKIEKLSQELVGLGAPPKQNQKENYPMKLNVSRQGILQNLKRTFSNKTTFVTELLQNARRAGASEVRIALTEDGKSITLVGDGCGITDWDALLCVGDTGWSSESEERPYGMGFFSAILSANHVYVSSRGQYIDFETADAVAGGSIELMHPAPEKTIVSLDLKEPLSLEAIELAVRGYSVPVIVNGRLLESPDAKNHEFIRMDGIGWLSPVTLECRYPRPIRLYLQDASVGVTSAYTFPEDGECAHLDNKFDARMPDRDRLIEEYKVLELVEAAVAKLKLEWLKSKLRGLHIGRTTYEAHKKFITTYYRHLKGWGLSSHFDYLSYERVKVFAVDSYPTVYNDQDCSAEAYKGFTTSRYVVVKKTVRGLVINRDVEEFSSFAAVMWAKGQGKYTEFFDTVGYSPNLTTLDSDSDFKVVVDGVVEQVGDVKPDRIIAKSIKIVCTNPEAAKLVKDPTVEVTEPFFDGSSSITYIPASCDCPSIALSQVNCYYVQAGCRFDDAAFDEDAKAIEDWFNYQISGDHLTLVQSKVGDLSAFAGKRVVLDISTSGHVWSVTVEDSDK